MKPTRILCATDLLETGRDACTVAVQFAKDFDASLRLVHSADVDVLRDYSANPSFSRHAQRAMLARVKERVEIDRKTLEAELARIRDLGIDATGELREGRAWEAVVAAAEEHDAELIVVGAHSGGRASRVLGTTADRVVRHVARPVLVTCGSGRKSWKGLSILVGVDFSKHAQRALDHATAWAKALGGDVTLVHVMTPPSPSETLPGTPAELEEMMGQAAHSELESWATGDGVARRVVRFGRPSDELVKLAADENHDLILLGTLGHSRIGSLLLGSTAERALVHSPVPVVLV